MVSGSDERSPTGQPRGGDAPDQPAREYEPLPEDWSAQAEIMVEGFVGPRLGDPGQRECLLRFARTSLQFAYLERRVQGDVLCEIPTHLSVLRGDQHPTLLDEAEELAAAERRNLELPDGPVEDLGELLDERGIKVIDWPGILPAPAGAFLFEELTGPSILSLAPANSSIGRFIQAHEYCHLLADVDPYESRFCPHGAGAGEDPLALGGRLLLETDLDSADDEMALAETRADLFARCLLVPREHFVSCLTEFGEGGRHGFHPRRLADVAYYYGVSAPVVLSRLVDIEILQPHEARALADDLPIPDRSQPDSDLPEGLADTVGGLPRRYVNLALALFMKHLVSCEQLGTLLNLTPPHLARFLAWVDLPPDLCGALPSVADDRPAADPPRGRCADPEPGH